MATYPGFYISTYEVGTRSVRQKAGILITMENGTRCCKRREGVYIGTVQSKPHSQAVPDQVSLSPIGDNEAKVITHE